MIFLAEIHFISFHFFHIQLKSISFCVCVTTAVVWFWFTYNCNLMMANIAAISGCCTNLYESIENLCGINKVHQTGLLFLVWCCGIDLDNFLCRISFDHRKRTQNIRSINLFIFFVDHFLFVSFKRKLRNANETWKNIRNVLRVCVCSFTFPIYNFDKRKTNMQKTSRHYNN